jgi:hypothetical protein
LRLSTAFQLLHLHLYLLLPLLLCMLHALWCCAREKGV